VIVIDPIRTPTAQAADLHLQPFPGSDAALAFALLHVLWRDGLVDYDFIQAHTVGWEELAPLLADCIPAWDEATTGVPAQLIKEAAHLYGRGRRCYGSDGGAAPAERGQCDPRLRPAASGDRQSGKPGAGFLYLNWNWNALYRYLDDAYLTALYLAAGPLLLISHMDLATCLEDPRCSQALVCWNMDIAASARSKGGCGGR
jgi:Molybdopterin oxidoreductase